MIYKRLGNTEIEIPAIGQGTTGVGSYQKFDAGNIAKRMDVWKHGMELGMTYLDTADLYGGGLSEETVGKLIKGIRDRVFIGSKFNPGEKVRESITASIEGSLKRLGTDYIDLYQLHWPNPFLSLAEIMETLSGLVRQGKIRHIGISNFSLDEFREAQALLPDNRIVSNQVEYNLLDRSIETDMLPYAASNNITLIAYSSLNQGSFMLNEEQKSVLTGLSRKYDKTIPQIIIRWLISHKPVIVLTQSGSMVHTEENALSADFDIDDTDISKINEIYIRQDVKVLPEQIRLNVSENKPAYNTVEEAIANPFDMIPSPRVLSRLIVSRKYAKPIRLVRTKDKSGSYEYDIDGYDIWDNVKKYWAWIIAYGAESPMPAVILEK